MALKSIRSDYAIFLLRQSPAFRNDFIRNSDPLILPEQLENKGLIKGKQKAEVRNLVFKTLFTLLRYNLAILNLSVTDENLIYTVFASQQHIVPLIDRKICS